MKSTNIQYGILVNLMRLYKGTSQMGGCLDGRNLRAYVQPTVGPVYHSQGVEVG